MRTRPWRIYDPQDLRGEGQAWQLGEQGTTRFKQGWRGREMAGPSPPPSPPSQIPDQQARPAPPASLLLRSPASSHHPSPTPFLSPPPSHQLPAPLPQPLSLSFIHPFIKLLLSAKAPLGPGARLGCVEKNKTKTWRILTNPWPGVGSSPTPAHLLSARPRLFDLHPARLSFSGLWPWPVDL